MVVTTVSDFSEELELNDAIHRPNYSPPTLAQPNRQRFKRRIAPPRSTVIAVDKSGRDLLFGAVQFVRQGDHLEGQQDVVLL